MKVTLVTKNNRPITVVVGSFSFEVVGNNVEHNIYSKTGCETVSNKELCMQLGLKFDEPALQRYNEAFELATLAWQAQSFDEVKKI